MIWPPNLAEWWLTLKDSYPWCYSILWCRGLAKSRDKLELLYPLYYSAYGHQTWQDVDLPHGLLPIKSYDPLIMCYYKSIWQTKTIISPLCTSSCHMLFLYFHKCCLSKGFISNLFRQIKYFLLVETTIA